MENIEQLQLEGENVNDLYQPDLFLVRFDDPENPVAEDFGNTAEAFELPSTAWSPGALDQEAGFNMEFARENAEYKVMGHVQAWKTWVTSEKTTVQVTFAQNPVRKLKSLLKGYTYAETINANGTVDTKFVGSPQTKGVRAYFISGQRRPFPESPTGYLIHWKAYVMPRLTVEEVPGESFKADGAPALQPVTFTALAGEDGYAIREIEGGPGFTAVDASGTSLAERLGYKPYAG